MIQTKEELFIAELGGNPQQEIELGYGSKIKLKKLLKDYHWVAKMIDWDSKKYGNCSCYESGDEIVARTEGETPVVAMAELWLKLNEKK